jgi:hypothetical protein
LFVLQNILDYYFWHFYPRSRDKVGGHFGRLIACTSISIRLARQGCQKLGMAFLDFVGGPGCKTWKLARC